MQHVHRCLPSAPLDACARTPALDTGMRSRYPTEAIEVLRLPGAFRVLLRPVLPQDGALLTGLLEALSRGSARARFHGGDYHAQPMLERLLDVDHRKSFALLATVCDAQGVETAIAEARWVIEDGPGPGPCAEFAIVVADRWHRLGLGRHLLCALQQAARRNGVVWMRGEIDAENRAMMRLARGCGFLCVADREDPRIVHAECVLGPPPARRRWHRRLAARAAALLGSRGRASLEGAWR